MVENKKPSLLKVFHRVGVFKRHSFSVCLCQQYDTSFKGCFHRLNSAFYVLDIENLNNIKMRICRMLFCNTN